MGSHHGRHDRTPPQVQRLRCHLCSSGQAHQNDHRRTNHNYTHSSRSSPHLPRPRVQVLQHPQEDHQQLRPTVRSRMDHGVLQETRHPTKPLNSIPPPDRWPDRTCQQRSGELPQSLDQQQKGQLGRMAVGCRVLNQHQTCCSHQCIPIRA